MTIEQARFTNPLILLIDVLQSNAIAMVTAKVGIAVLFIKVAYLQCSLESIVPLATSLAQPADYLDKISALSHPAIAITSAKVATVIRFVKPIKPLQRRYVIKGKMYVK
ncbi:hypothetical protein FGO68_gene11833 [Halteria grandinella]|uniref:Uncharacterized protein n=1 Tax=Halteria grandinella TaxID=5974 RepID=A0A8J8NFR1_HALGN|nr:hypothetical protein FGO68_gene11833 [Halteria grandinella]